MVGIQNSVQELNVFNCNDFGNVLFVFNFLRVLFVVFVKKKRIVFSEGFFFVDFVRNHLSVKTQKSRKN